MEKTLSLLALLGTIVTAPLTAREVWWTGVTHDPETKKMEGAITTYKHYYAGDSDSNMCWVAAACNVIAWWQDRVEENGALIIPKEAPRDYEVFETERHLWPNVGGYEGTAMQMWLTGPSKLQLSPYPGYDATEEGLAFKGYYPRLAGASLNSSNYKSTFGANPDTMKDKPYYTQYEYTMIQTYYFLHSNHDPDDPEKIQYQWASEKIAEFMEDDWGVSWATAIHAMTVYGVELDENDLVTKFYNSDNNWASRGQGYYSELTVGLCENPENPGYMDTSWNGSSSEVNHITAMRTTGIRFLDYDVRVGDNIEGDDEAVFSHYCNLIVDGAEDYKLQYDLRDAKAPDSPVDALRVRVETEDDWLSSYEVFTDEEVPTGDMHFKGGKVTLVEGVGKYDGGGSVEGTIFFEESAVQGTGRTLVVDRTDTIAGEINLGATSGANTLLVTEGNTATIGKLTGTGALDITGAGTLVNDGSIVSSVTLNVKAGSLKGSGTFGAVAIDGGRLIVGNSPGRQEYLGALSVNAGDIVFSVDGWETAADGEHVGWGSGMYSNIVMNGNALTFADGVSLEFAVAGDALSAMFDNSPGGFTMTIATGIGNKEYFTSDLLKMLAQETIFYVASEQGAVIANDAGLKAGDTLNTRITDLEYKLVDNSKLCVTGVYWAAEPVVPEPATGTLGLLALTALASRRRRK